MASPGAARGRGTYRAGTRTANRFFETPADVAVIGGSVFDGKTWSLTAEPLLHIEPAGFSAVTFRHDKTEI
jgi:hypothetical protein